MKLCIVLVVLGVLGTISGPQTVSGHVAEVARKLTVAMYAGDVAAVEQEANAGNVNALNDLGQNSLHVAIKLNNVDNLRMVEILVAKGADVNHIALDGSVPLQAARGKPEIEELLRKHGATIV